MAAATIRSERGQMGIRGDLVDKWRAKLADGSHDDCMDADELRPGSYCAVFDMCWGGPGCGMVSMLAPEYFDSPGDFVAYVRVVELPRSLDMMCRGLEDASEDHPPAEACLDSVDADSRQLAEAVIAAADAALDTDIVTPSDAEAVVAAFNALFGRRRDAQFIASGDVAAIFTAGRITGQFDAWSADDEDILDEDEPEMIVKRLLDAGEFDPFSEEHLEPVREMLAGFPNC